MYYSVYIIKSIDNRYSYIGMTNNFLRRIRQHNREIKGGAKYTSKSVKWIPIMIIDGFVNKKEAMQCEWKLKRKGKGIINRLKYINYLLNNSSKWTKNSPLIKSQQLHIYIMNNYEKYIHYTNSRELYFY